MWGYFWGYIEAFNFIRCCIINAKLLHIDSPRLHQAVAIADLGTLRGRLFISPGIHLNTEGMKMLIVLYLTMQCNCSSIALQWMDGKKEGMTCLVN